MSDEAASASSAPTQHSDKVSIAIKLGVVDPVGVLLVVVRADSLVLAPATPSGRQFQIALSIRLSCSGCVG